MRQNRYTLYSACFSPALLLGTCGCKLYVSSLIKKFVVGSEGKFGRNVDRNFDIVLIVHHNRMPATIQRHIVSCITRIRDANTLDQAHSTREYRVMAFHAHYHRYCRDISKNQDKIGKKCKEFVFVDVESSDALE